MSQLADLLLAATAKGTNDYAGFKQLSAVEIGEILTEARAEKHRLVPGEHLTSLRTKLRDGGEGRENEKLTAIVELTSNSICVGAEGFGECGAANGHGRPVIIELYDGVFRLLVWSDINSEDPTHTIELTGAKEEARSGD